jgi:hypothetical protein
MTIVMWVLIFLATLLAWPIIGALAYRLILWIVEENYDEQTASTIIPFGVVVLVVAIVLWPLAYLQRAFETGADRLQWRFIFRLAGKPKQEKKEGESK